MALISIGARDNNFYTQPIQLCVKKCQCKGQIINNFIP